LIKIGLIGKTNVGKTTFFNSATLLNAEISARPFTTKQSNVGTAYTGTVCVCRELGVKDNPRNSACINGWRFIPATMVDLPGLIKGAWQGKGLGNQFLTIAMRTDVLLHVVDASGSINENGEMTKSGTGDPVQDIYDVEQEIVAWLANILEKNKTTIAKQLTPQRHLDTALYRTLSGMKVKRQQIAQAIETTGIYKDFKDWTNDDIELLAKNIRKLSKPTLIVANKTDLPAAEHNFNRLVETFKETFVVPCSAESELALRRAEKSKLIKYIPGEEAFRIIDDKKLTSQQLTALDYVQKMTFTKWARTGVQFAINLAIFKLLRMNAIYPVEDISRFSDTKGRVLPDAILTTENSTVKDLAKRIHTDLAKTMIHAIDARTGLRLPKEYILRDRDVIKIVSASEKK
jgi:ribosome-binding ATPase YchF (GTP1/OBG family)